MPFLATRNPPLVMSRSRLVFGAAIGIALATLGRAAASDITSAITSSGLPYVDWSITGNTIVVSATVPPTHSDFFPVFLNVASYSGTSGYYDANVTMSGTANYTDLGSAPAAYLFSNASGNLSVTSSAKITFQNAAGAFPGAISVGGIVAVANPLGFGHSAGNGGNVSVEHNGNITVAGNGSDLGYGTPLVPLGFRMADVAGIAAASIGEQVTNSNTHPGGYVIVTTDPGSTISMSNSGLTAITAGISAASASGPGNGTTNAGFDGNGTQVYAFGAITNSAASGVGIMATNTGAQFYPSSASVASNGGVIVELEGAGSLSVTGETGIGIFAVSEAYTTSEPKKNSSVSGGTVNVSTDAGTVISTGTAGSLFSIGVLAASAGTDSFLDPFSSHQVNGTGNGYGGAVNITHNGAIETTGTLSAGIAALSLGGAAIVTTNSGTAGQASALGNSGDTDSFGSDGSDVFVGNSGSITTVGANAYGVVALSTGGGGLLNNEEDLLENAGVVTGGLVVGNASTTNSGTAANGGQITVNNSGSIVTGDGSGSGVASMGIVAQSIGGGGGNAGGNKAAWFVGDKGGLGGAGGEVDVTLAQGSQLTTKDENSIGVLAQSIGGGGGNGANAKGIFVAVGGRGGHGGNGGEVDINFSGSLNTLADHSSGVIAQSVGGGGGHGGAATEIGIGFGTAIGGAGGGGGNGGLVTFSSTSNSAITTVGNNATAVHLQSIGGGGGDGGAGSSMVAGGGTGEGVALSISIAVGGAAGTGGKGGTVTGTNAGTITTGVAFSGSDGVPNMDGADSIGMMAQSIGGGGGHGGAAMAKSLAVSTGTAAIGTVKLDISLGGAGGEGGDGGAASLVNQGEVETWGDGSHGLLGQSIGGGGGNGGDSTAASALSAKSGAAVTITTSVGGAGGSGGKGETVTLQNSGADSLIETHGQNAIGMVAQSIGGGGGNGGAGNSALHTPFTGTESATSLNMVLSAGGTGGGGGNSGYVEVDNSGTISTAGSGGKGILAQSIGGGGGNATGANAAGSNNAITINLVMGAAGGTGGSASGTNSLGDSVTVNNSGDIFTIGGNGAGITAQSIGGGGGTGGSADAEASVGKIGTATNLLFSSTGYSSNLSIGAAIAGDGGGGGAGGNVQVNQSGAISTQGFQSYGVLAQSISGGGGQGGAATAASNPGLFDGYDGTLQFAANVAVGGKGGDGSSAGAVTVVNSGSTSTAGYGAHAVVAQSIAGGGGVGGDGTVDADSTIGLGAALSNATGSKTVTGGAVQVTQSGNIGTTGGDASGIVAQSIGAGGGIGSTGSDRALISPEFSAGILPLHLDFTLGVNIRSNYAGNGGGVTVDVGLADNAATTVRTLGDFSHGVVAQSIGAGGGKASAILGTNSNAYADFSSQGINLGATAGKGNGGAVAVTVSGQVATGTASTGYGAYGVLAQSIGGGGGLATVDAAASNGGISLGGSGTNASGNGGTVNFNGTAGSVSTSGETAHGVVLQSIGGGGGVANVGSSRTFSGSISAATPGSSLGGRDSAGTGGVVSYDAQVDVTTSGNHAFGLVAQSIGGGGGIATLEKSNFNYLGAIESTHEASAYNGGAVNIDLLANSSVVTTGVGSHGVVAQSIGGGGGIATPTSVGALQTSPTGVTAINASSSLGYGGPMTINVTGNVFTSGAGANGMVLQTLSGGGGLSADFAGVTGTTGSTGSTNTGTTAGTLSVVVGSTGTVSASGADATGIFAQNVTAGAYGMGKISLEVAGKVSGGSGAGAHGIWVVGGNTNNTLTVDQGGEVSALNAEGLSAIHYTGSTNLEVSNSGIVKGSVSLSEGSVTGTFTNNDDGVFFAQGEIYANVVNNGQFTVGVDDNTGAVATVAGEFHSIEAGVNTPVVFMDVISTSDYDQLMFSEQGRGDFIGSLTVSFASSYQAQVNDQFTLIGAGYEDGNEYNFASMSVNLNPGITYEFTTPGDQLVLTITGIPEPATAGLVVLGIGGLLARRRRRTGV